MAYALLSTCWSVGLAFINLKLIIGNNSRLCPPPPEFLVSWFTFGNRCFLSPAVLWSPRLREHLNSFTWSKVSLWQNILICVTSSKVPAGLSSTMKAFQPCLTDPPDSDPAACQGRTCPVNLLRRGSSYPFHTGPPFCLSFCFSLLPAGLPEDDETQDIQVFQCLALVSEDSRNSC